MNAKREMIELTCELSDVEVLERARAGATAEEELVRLARARADWTTAHKKQVEEQQGTAARMSSCVRTGREKRLVACITEFHTPVQAKKRTSRLDTGEQVGEDVLMTPNELQENLFPEVVNHAGLSLVKPEEEASVSGVGYVSDGQEEE